MQRIVVAPCSPFSVSRELMRDAALLAREHGVSLHTHLAENDNDIAYTREKFGCTPAEYAEQLGWLGRDVWHAHCVKLDAAGIALFARTGTGVAHCPGSNMRLASGIAPIRAMRDAGVPVSIAVDGSASNDSGHMLGEARLALLLQRVAHGPVSGPSAMTAREVLEIATLGGAQVLGRDDIGALAPGMAADIVTVPLDEIGLAGALHDPLAALFFCHVPRVTHSIVNGRVVVRDGQLTTLDLPRADRAPQRAGGRGWPPDTAAAQRRRQSCASSCLRSMPAPAASASAQKKASRVAAVAAARRASTAAIGPICSASTRCACSTSSVFIGVVPSTGKGPLGTGRAAGFRRGAQGPRPGDEGGTLVGFHHLGGQPGDQPGQIVVAARAVAHDDACHRPELRQQQRLDGGQRAGVPFRQARRHRNDRPAGQRTAAPAARRTASARCRAASPPSGAASPAWPSMRPKRSRRIVSAQTRRRDRPFGGIAQRGAHLRGVGVARRRRAWPWRAPPRRRSARAPRGCTASVDGAGGSTCSTWYITALGRAAERRAAGEQLVQQHAARRTGRRGGRALRRCSCSGAM